LARRRDEDGPRSSQIAMKGLKAFRVEDEPVEWGADEAPKKPRAPQPASANLTRDEARCLAEKFAKTPSVMAQRRKGWHVMPSPVAQSTDGSAPRTAATAAQQGIIQRQTPPRAG
jgi:hypothetical protein